MEFSHGLCFGRRQLTILTPQPLSLTSRLCLPSHLLTSLEMCQLAFSQIEEGSSCQVFRAPRSITRACTEGIVFLTYTVFDEAVGEEVERLEVVPCRRCADNR